MEESGITHAQKKTVELMGCLKIDTYQLPSGEFRIDLSSISTALGYASNWLSRITTRKGKAHKALLGKGFTDYQQEVKVTRSGKSGASKALTIGIDDFLSVVQYAADEHNPIAIAYLSAAAKRSTVDDIREAWGEEKLSLDERRRIYCEELAKSFTVAEWAETSKAGQAFDWEKAKNPEWLIMMFSHDWQPSLLLQGVDMDQYAEELYAREKEGIEEV